MVHPNYKKQKVGDSTSIYKEEVLFNSDTLSKVISYLPSIDLINLALTCTRFGISNNDELSVIKKSTHITVHDIATEEQLAALPHYNGESSLADYHYLQLLRAPLLFDQLVGAEYANSGDKSCITSGQGVYEWKTAFSSNILRAGKHYAIFETSCQFNMLTLGVMRPGEANQNARGMPISKEFYQNFSRNMGTGEYNSDVNCCLYYAYSGRCHSSRLTAYSDNFDDWVGSESLSFGDQVGMLLDLDEGTLTVYKNGRRLGVMMRGLAGPYCWVASVFNGSSVSIKRGTIPPS